MPAQTVPVYPRRPAPCATPEKRINSSPPLLLPSGFPGYRASNPDGFLCVVPPPARPQGERDHRVVTSTASRPAARLRAELLGDVLQAMGHGCGTHLGGVHLETRSVWRLGVAGVRVGGRTELWPSLCCPQFYFPRPSHPQADFSFLEIKFLFLSQIRVSPGLELCRKTGNSDFVHFKRCERNLCSGGACKHGDFEIQFMNSEPKVCDVTGSLVTKRGFL